MGDAAAMRVQRARTSESSSTSFISDTNCSNCIVYCWPGTLDIEATFLYKLSGGNKLFLLENNIRFPLFQGSITIEH